VQFSDILTKLQQIEAESLRLLLLERIREILRQFERFARSGVVQQVEMAYFIGREGA